MGLSLTKEEKKKDRDKGEEKEEEEEITSQYFDMPHIILSAPWGRTFVIAPLLF